VVIADASVLIAWLAGESGREVGCLADLLGREQVQLAPVTVTELLSHTRQEPVLDELVSKLRVLELTPGYWERAGRTRARLRGSARKAALGDALVAQACIDADVPLLTRDRDFKAFAELAGLKLA